MSWGSGYRNRPVHIDIFSLGDKEKQGSGLFPTSSNTGLEILNRVQFVSFQPQYGFGFSYLNHPAGLIVSKHLLEADCKTDSMLYRKYKQLY